MGGRRPLPEVGVRGVAWLRSGRMRGERLEEGLMLEQVVRRVVEGMSVELARELVEV
jgi:hypothetical protein